MLFHKDPPCIQCVVQVEVVWFVYIQTCIHYQVTDSNAHTHTPHIFSLSASSLAVQRKTIQCVY